MITKLQKKKADLVCQHCGKIDEIWILKYESCELTQNIYLCGKCENIIKIEKNIIETAETREDDVNSEVKV